MKTISFYGTCLARSSKVVVSKLITHAYIVREIHATFAKGCVNRLLLEFVIAHDDEAPATGKPNGVSMLADYGQVSYVVGDATKKVMQHSVEIDVGGTYVKVYAVNDDYHDHDIDVQVMIEELARRE